MSGGISTQLRRQWIAEIAHVLLCTLIAALPAAGQVQPWVPVYTRNYTPDGKGYMKENIAASVDAVKKMGAETGFTVDVSEYPGAFTDNNLQQYSALIFSNSNNQAFSDEAQRAAFRHFIQSDGGFVGIRSADSERDWPHFWSVLGGKFAVHSKMQLFAVEVADPSFPATKGLPVEFPWTDECHFIGKLNPDIRPVPVTDRTKLTGVNAMKTDTSRFRNPLPLAWYHRLDGGREFYVALGHDNEDNANPVLFAIIENGIVWALGANTH